jgi:hypothetical protein
MNSMRIAFAWLAFACIWHSAVSAQGQDGHPAERDVQVLAELLPGRYDNWNQNYFDGRRKLPETERHERLHTRIVRVTAPAFGAVVFYAEDYRDNEPSKVTRRRVLALAPDIEGGGARLKIYWIDDRIAARFGAALTVRELWSAVRPDELRYVPGCDLWFVREVGQYSGASRATQCLFKSAGIGEVYGEYRMLIAPSGIEWHELQRDRRGRVIAGHASGVGYDLQRAREFKCNADMPGVGGGAAIPFERYAGLELHDKGGAAWFKTREREPREFQIVLSAVNWPINNETGAFTRNSLVLYVNERVSGEIKNHGYSGTDPKVDRLFINLKWMLVNCYMQFNRDVRPEF